MSVEDIAREKLQKGIEECEGQITEDEQGQKYLG